MKVIKKILKWSLYTLMIPMSYILIALLAGLITVNNNIKNHDNETYVYLNTNGVHLDIILPVRNIESDLIHGINTDKNDKYLAFGWGDMNFYLYTPTWDKLKTSTLLRALFWKSSTLIHISKYKNINDNWIKVKANKKVLKKLNNYILNSFDLNNNHLKIKLNAKGYTNDDTFYKAKGSYSCFKTCNTWVNNGFKESGLKSCLWTPFDFALINLYKK